MNFNMWMQIRERVHCFANVSNKDYTVPIYVGANVKFEQYNISIPCFATKHNLVIYFVLC